MTAPHDAIIGEPRLLADLRKCLDHWRQLDEERWAAMRELNLAHGLAADCVKEGEANERELTDRMAREAEPFLHYLVEDNRSKSPEELEAIATKLSPGGAHTGGLLARVIYHNIVFAEPTLLAAMIYANWSGGKVGFQFLPDPAEVEPEEYFAETDQLIELFDGATDSNPRRILVGEDREFYDSLPDRFTVYRGCAGISAEIAGAGVCWTTRREIAEWFATRAFQNPEAPVLVTARVGKAEVRLARASEFEIVVPGRRARQLKCRRRKKPTIMHWADSCDPRPAH